MLVLYQISDDQTKDQFWFKLFLIINDGISKAKTMQRIDKLALLNSLQQPEKIQHQMSKQRNKTTTNDINN